MGVNQKEIKELLHYNPDTGLFSWRNNITHNIKAGDIAGGDNHGYISITIKGKLYYAHRLAWLYVYGEVPPNQIDHINHDKSDNRIANIRPVSNSENQKNKPVRENSKSGVAGVNWDASRKKWAARITVNYKYICLGRHTKKEDAVLARKEAERKYGFGVT